MFSLYFWQLPKSGESYETGLSSYAMWNICLKLLEQFIPDYIIVSSFIGEHFLCSVTSVWPSLLVTIPKLLFSVKHSRNHGTSFLKICIWLQHQKYTNSHQERIFDPTFIQCWEIHQKSKMESSLLPQSIKEAK